MRGKDLHLDCFSGLAGDMFLGACLDLGMPQSVVEEAVAALQLHGIAVESRKARRAGFAGTRFRVLDHGKPIEGPDPDEIADRSRSLEGGEKLSVKEGATFGGSAATLLPLSDAAGANEFHHHGGRDHHHDQDHGHVDHEQSSPGHDHLYQQAFSSFHKEPGHPHGHGRHLAEILALLDGSALAEPVKSRARALFHRLGEAEAKAHGMAIERVHFHEVGAVDSIVDLVGATAAVEWLAPRRITCGAVNIGGGSVTGAHGRMPVPPPAVAELMRGLPVYGSDRSVGELLTPTGAVLLAELVDDFVELPTMIVEGVGYGLGRKEASGCVNAVRLISGRPWPGAEPGSAAHASSAQAEVLVVECEVDDLSGEGLGHAMSRLLAEGALDVYLTPVQMKKGRPGSLVSLLCRRPDLERLAGVLLAETGSLGCRFHTSGRFEAERESATVTTPFGEVHIKRARFRGRTIANAPEYEDCRRLAEASGTTWRTVYEAALVAALEASSSL